MYPIVPNGFADHYPYLLNGYQNQNQSLKTAKPGAAYTKKSFDLRIWQLEQLTDAESHQSTMSKLTKSTQIDTEWYTYRPT